MKTAIVSGCDNKYFHKLFNLYNSLLKNNCLKNADFCVFSIDLKDEYIKKLSETNTKIIEPGWDFKFKFQTQDWKKILTVRPFLKNYFKDYDNYIWLDADTWVQGNNFINDFANVSSLGKMSIIPEHDINYEINKNKYSFKKILFNLYQAQGWSYSKYKKYFGNKIAEKLFLKPILNAGVYSLPKNSEIWSLWAAEYEKVINQSKDDYSLFMDQSSLNKIVYENLNLVNFFGTEYNYLCKNYLPLFNEEKNCFCANDYPFKKIEIIHLTDIIFDKLYDIKTINGSTIKKQITSKSL